MATNDPKKCPSCGYLRMNNDTEPDWQCPKCGIAYNKFSQEYHQESYRKKLIMKKGNFSISKIIKIIFSLFIICICIYLYIKWHNDLDKWNNYPKHSIYNSKTGSYEKYEFPSNTKYKQVKYNAQSAVKNDLIRLNININKIYIKTKAIRILVKQCSDTCKSNHPNFQICRKANKFWLENANDIERLRNYYLNNAYKFSNSEKVMINKIKKNMSIIATEMEVANALCKSISN